MVNTIILKILDFYLNNFQLIYLLINILYSS